MKNVRLAKMGHMECFRPKMGHESRRRRERVRRRPVPTDTGGQRARCSRVEVALILIACAALYAMLVWTFVP